MTAQQLLQSDVLDILFEGKNKAYGAYELRKAYNGRMSRALLIMVMLVVIICAFVYARPAAQNNKVAATDQGGLVTLPPPDKKPVKPETQQVKKQQTAPNVATINAITPPVIVPDLQADPMPPVSVIDTSAIGDTNAPGQGTGNSINIPNGTGEPVDGPGTSNMPVATPAPEPAVYDMNVVEIKPQYPGDLSRFLQRNLRHPDDIETGQKVVVRMQFIIDENGQPGDFKLLQSGGTQYDNEVLRVMQKMAKWSPAVQNGRHVPVRFVLPVTFTGPEE